MRVVVDYRPALRSRSGVGEYVHQLVSALVRAEPPDRPEVTIFSSSWKDRLQVAPELNGVHASDFRIPVSVLNVAWHRLEWPPVELLTRQACDVAHSLHPLLMPSRRAAAVITIHDLDFLAHPERTAAEIRRDYPSLCRAHAHRADAIVVPSAFTAGQVVQQLGVPRERIEVCPPGAPDWAPRAGEPPRDGYILFLGTLEPRKNVATLLDAYERLLAAEARGPRVHPTAGDGLAASPPELVLAGNTTAQSAPVLQRLGRPPLAGRVRHIGYVDPSRRRAVYEGARLLVQPSFEEGFGLPVLEAMTLGVPVVAADRGALPEVLGDAGLLVAPTDAAAMAAAIDRMLRDEAFARTCTTRGRARSRTFRWEHTARLVCETYRRALERRCRAAGRGRP